MLYITKTPAITITTSPATAARTINAEGWLRFRYASLKEGAALQPASAAICDIRFFTSPEPASKFTRNITAGEKLSHPSISKKYSSETIAAYKERSVPFAPVFRYPVIRKDFSLPLFGSGNRMVSPILAFIFCRIKYSCSISISFSFSGIFPWSTDSPFNISVSLLEYEILRRSFPDLTLPMEAVNPHRSTRTSSANF